VPGMETPEEPPVTQEAAQTSADLYAKLTKSVLEPPVAQEEPSAQPDGAPKGNAKKRTLSLAIDEKIYEAIQLLEVTRYSAPGSLPQRLNRVNSALEAVYAIIDKALSAK